MSQIMERHLALPPLPPLAGPRAESSLMGPDKYHTVGDASFRELPGLDGRSLICDGGYKSEAGSEVHAFMVRAKGSITSPWHMHHNETFGILTRGWGLWDFEGSGVVKVEAGTMFHQPPFNRHRELDMSADCEQFIVTCSTGDTRTTLFLFDDATGEYIEKVIDTADITKYCE